MTMTEARSAAMGTDPRAGLLEFFTKPFDFLLLFTDRFTKCRAL